MLTRTGWLAGAGAIGLVAGGRLFAVFPAFVVGATVAALVVVAAVTVALTHLRLDVARALHPTRVHAGVSSSVVLEVRNRGRRRTPVLVFTDQVSGTRGARLALAPLEPEATTGAAYELPTAHRGILSVGPLQVVVSDAFGLAQARVEVTGVSELTVYPRVDDVAPIPLSSGTDPHAGRDHPNNLSPAGEDFFALRPYVVGDDLRRVHWASTARHDDLMVRQDELPWQGRATVFLDTRGGDRPDEALEPAVSAAASLIRAGRRQNHQLRLVTSDGIDSGFATSHAQIEAIMEHLAVVATSGRSELAPALGRLARAGGGTLVALLPGAVPVDDLAAISRLRTRYGRVIPVLFDPSCWDVAAAPRAPQPAHGRAVHVTAGVPFARAWDQLVRARSSGAPARGSPGPAVARRAPQPR